MPLFEEAIQRGPRNTAKKGEITEIMVLAKLIQLGYACLIPWGHDHRYDIAIDDAGRLVRIQCKTAHYSEETGCLGFNTAITYARAEESRILLKDIRAKPTILEYMLLTRRKFICSLSKRHLILSHNYVYRRLEITRPKVCAGRRNMR